MSNWHSFDKHVIMELLDPQSDQGDVTGTWQEIFAGGAAADRAIYIMTVGTHATDTIDFKLEQATDAAGTGAKDITGAAIVQLVAATGDDKLYSIDIGPGAIDDKNGFSFVRYNVLVGGAGTEPWGMIRIKYRLRNPGKLAQGATWAQIVRVYD
jgi:hypothetical protein